MGNEPLLVGGDHDSVAEAFPGSAVTEVGADGGSGAGDALDA
jgi:hypothetical protein